MNNDNIPEEILREWIVKAKPLVDSAWNLAIDECIKAVNELNIEIFPEIPSGLSINEELLKRKKDIK